MAHEYALT